MNSRIDQYRVRKFGSLIAKLRTVMMIQGVLWIIAGLSLLTIVDVAPFKVILMFVLGVAFIGWGYSIDREKWLSDSYMANKDFDLQTEPGPDEIKFYSL